MRIAVVTYNNLSTNGGFIKVVSSVLTHLRERHSCDVSILSLVKSASELNRPILEEVKSFVLCRDTDYKNLSHLFLHALSRKISGKEILLNYFALERCLVNLTAPDIFIVNEPLLLRAVEYFVQRHKLKSKVVYWDHGMLPYISRIKNARTQGIKLIFGREIRHGIKHADAHLAISSGISDMIKSIEPAAKVYLVYNPLPAYSGPLVRRSKQPIFLYIGRLVERPKNLSLMLKGLARIKHKNWELRIIGTGPDENKLRHLAHRLKICDRIKWLGFREDPYAELKEATALLLTSKSEGFGLVIVEANQRGIPVISSDCESGPSDIVISGINGYLFKEGDVNSFVEILSGVIDGSLTFATPEEIAKTANRFIAESVVESIYKALCEIVDGKN